LGGCVEDDLIDCVRRQERVTHPALMTYGVTKEEAARFGWRRSRCATASRCSRKSRARPLLA